MLKQIEIKSDGNTKEDNTATYQKYINGDTAKQNKIVN